MFTRLTEPLPCTRPVSVAPAVDSAEDLPKGSQVEFGESIIVYEQPEGGGYAEQQLVELDHVTYDEVSHVM